MDEESDFLLLLLFAQLLDYADAHQEEDENAFLSLALLELTFAMRTRHYLGRSAIPTIDVSAITVLLAGGGDRDYLTVMSVDRATFDELGGLLQAHFDCSRSKRGRKSSVDARYALAVLLHWLNSTMGGKTLMQISGLVESDVSKHKSKAFRGLLTILPTIADCAVSLPNRQERKRLAQV